MLRKVVNALGNVGLVLLAAGSLYYLVTNVWDWKSQVSVYGGAALVLIYLALNIGSIRDALGSRKGRLGTTALATLVLVGGILILANFLNFRHHKRVDLTEGQVHSLSAQTKQVLENLEQKIEVVAFFQDEVEAARFQETIQEYHYLNDFLEFEIVDPQREPGKVGQYEISRDGQVVIAGPTKREIVEDPSEEKITNAIIKVTRDVEKVIYFLTGHGERDIEDSGEEGYATTREEIEKQNYKVQAYNLALENQLPEDAAAIISVSPNVSFMPNEIELLEQYLTEGGKLLLLVDAGSKFQMNQFLEKYGITIEDDFVVDATGVGELFGFGPAAPLAAEYPDHPITEDLRGTMTIYPMARSVVAGSSELDYTTQKLVESSPRSWGESDPTGGKVAFDEGLDRQGPLTLAAVATKSVSGDASEGSDGETTEDSAGEEPLTDGEDSLPEEPGSAKEARLVVFGDADFASNAYLGISANKDMFLNVVSWLAEDADLISVRAKDPESRSMALTAAESRLIFLATVVFFPLATLVFGFAIWIRRR